MADITIKTNETFLEATGNNIGDTSYLRLFNILLDVDRETKFMNIFKSVTINENVQTDVLTFHTYEVPEDNLWDNISYEAYDTPKLWWLVALFNDVTNPFEELNAGDNIKILRQEHIRTVFNDMERISEL